jgi:hypothetical protein
MLFKFWINLEGQIVVESVKRFQKSHLLNLLKIQEIAIWNRKKKDLSACHKNANTKYL